MPPQHSPQECLAQLGWMGLVLWGYLAGLALLWLTA